MDPKIARGTFFSGLRISPCNDRHGFKSDETVEDVDGCTRNRTEETCSTFQLKERCEVALAHPTGMKKMAKSEKRTIGINFATVAVRVNILEVFRPAMFIRLKRISIPILIGRL